MGLKERNKAIPTPTPTSNPTPTPTATPFPTFTPFPTATPTPNPTPTPTPPPSTLVVAPEQYYLLEGASIVAQDGEFIGIFSLNEFSSNSIANEYGEYGSPYRSKSIWNPYGTYGSPYRSYSVFNDYTSTPPVIFVGDDAICYLTSNEFKTPRVDPYELAFVLDRETP